MQEKSEQVFALAKAYIVETLVGIYRVMYQTKIPFTINALPVAMKFTEHYFNEVNKKLHYRTDEYINRQFDKMAQVAGGKLPCCLLDMLAKKCALTMHYTFSKFHYQGCSFDLTNLNTLTATSTKETEQHLDTWKNDFVTCFAHCLEHCQNTDPTYKENPFCFSVTLE